MNHAMKAELIRRGQAFGVLAYRDDSVVGWCHAAPQLTLKRMEEYREEPGFRAQDAGEVGSIVCLVVAPGERGAGVGSALVEAACEMLGGLGMGWAEAYPLSQTPEATERLSREARSYHGSLSMYQRAAFERQYDIDGVSVVRRRLRNP
jgi:GNAT superfamily N-acetyltransferase